MFFYELGVEIEEDDSGRSHRLGKPIARFARYAVRKEIVFEQKETEW